MLINIQADSESSSSGIDTAQMQFDVSKQAKLFHMLSSSLYSDKPGSIIRELCSNCHDSHIMAGRTHIPFILKGPTFEHPFLSVKDFGVGLTSEEAVKTILCYLGSNKDQSAEYIGGWGIGSKSPFAYAKNYNVIVIKNGMRAEFACWKDEHGLPSQALIDHSPTDEPNGVEMVVPVEPEDIRKFTEAIETYMQWTNYNVSTTSGTETLLRRTPVETVECEKYTIELFADGSGEHRIVYGGQSYDMEACVDNRYDDSGDWLQLKEAASKDYDIAIVVHKPGSLDFNMNREELEQTDKTRVFVHEVVRYLSAGGVKHARTYADEMEQWKEGLKTRRDSGDCEPISLVEVNEMIERALSRGNNADRFFGKAFRVFDQKLRYDLRGTTHHLTQYSGVTRIHSLPLVIAELHTQFEFVYGRIMGLNHVQRRAASAGTHSRQVIYVKAETREQFDAWWAGHADFKGLDSSKYRVKFVDIPKNAPSARSYSTGLSVPRIYDVTTKSYLTYNERVSYLISTPGEMELPPEKLEFIAAAGAAPTFRQFVPTADFLKRSRPANVITVAEFISRHAAKAEQKLDSVAGMSGRRLFKIKKLLKNIQLIATSSLPPLLEDRVTLTCSIDLDNRVDLAEELYRDMGGERFRKAGKGDTTRIINELSKLYKEMERVTEVTRYVRIDRLARDLATTPPGAKALALVESLGIAEYFNK